MTDFSLSSVNPLLWLLYSSPMHPVVTDGISSLSGSDSSDENEAEEGGSAPMAKLPGIYIVAIYYTLHCEH